MIINGQNVLAIKVMYHKELYPDLMELESHGNFIDLRAAKNYDYKAGDSFLIDLGVSIELEEGYWAQIVPRSSTFTKYGIIQTNSFGVIDNSYCGPDDIWKMPVYAIRDGSIKANDRVCQFRVVKDDPVIICSVETLTGKNRGGFGSTGNK